ncbi:T9SS type A sorting domain-containing protein [candidate division KSB1 bacterium]|nr:T9SS type A sorting domain-containing protein [candidate division KSB1 bacterium]
MKSNSCRIVYFIILIVVPFQIYAIDSKIDQIRQAIAEKGANWTAAENWVTRLSFEEQRRLCGTFLETRGTVQGKLLTLPQVAELPAALDWRNNNGNYITPVKRQGLCGSCWAFAALAHVESWWKIYHANVDSMIDLSEQFLIACENTGSCNGGYTGYALSFVQSNGIPGEACMPYTADDEIPCSEACETWREEAVRIPGFGMVTMDDADVERIKNALYVQPVVASFIVYEDFLSYSGGVYEHVTGNKVDGHAILIIGWNDAEQSWLCKNSWSAAWGDKGFFRIKWGNCGIGRYVYFIWDELTFAPALALTQTETQHDLTVGDMASEQIMLKNRNDATANYFIIDRQVQKTKYFHPDTFNAWEGKSWWCADTGGIGYLDGMMEHLDTPVLDLSQTSYPQLSGKIYWSVETLNDTFPPEPPYDGWDGGNVWLSQDGGVNFEVIRPDYPAYNHQSLSAFGFGHDLGTGPGIPGWGETSNGWQSFAFDLSPYRAKEIIIRFGFASDRSGCTKTDSTWTGFFIDDILIQDGSTVLFENNGDSGTAMCAGGFRTSPAQNWLSVQEPFGTIQAHDSTVITYTINTRGLDPGEYDALLYFSVNDTTMLPAKYFINMHLQAPAYDGAVIRSFVADEAVTILTGTIPEAEIANKGILDLENITVICSITYQGKNLYTDTLNVSTLSSGDEKMLQFKPFYSTLAGDLDMNVELIPPPGDYNDYNDSYHAQLLTTNLVDDFTENNEKWLFQGGWGLTERFIGHSGKRTAHVNHGVTPYENNMDASMTFTPGFNLQDVDSVAIGFWTVHIIEQDCDFCYVEVSGDSLNWIKMDSLTGTTSKWMEHRTSLQALIEAGYDKAWLRFHFVSDSANTGVGCAIDDVAVYVSSDDATIVEDPLFVEPSQYRLAQNYPNPFNPQTTIVYELPRSEHVRLEIYDMLGRHVRTLHDGFKTAGKWQVNWNGTDESIQPVAAGVYFYRMQVGKFVKVIKMVLIR